MAVVYCPNRRIFITQFGDNWWPKMEIIWILNARLAEQSFLTHWRIVDWRKNSTFALTQWNNGEEHWNSAVYNSWTTENEALQYSEHHLVTTIPTVQGGSLFKTAKLHKTLIIKLIIVFLYQTCILPQARTHSNKRVNPKFR